MVLSSREKVIVGTRMRRVAIKDSIQTGIRIMGIAELAGFFNRVEASNFCLDVPNIHISTKLLGPK
jgi:hypothetical protein